MISKIKIGFTHIMSVLTELMDNSISNYLFAIACFGVLVVYMLLIFLLHFGFGVTLLTLDCKGLPAGTCVFKAEHVIYWRRPPS